MTPDLIPTIVASHGDLALAAERLNISTSELTAQLHTIPTDELATAIRNATLIQNFEIFTSFKLVVLNTLADLSPIQRANFLEKFAQHITGLVAPPPVQGPSGPTSHNTVTLNLLNAMQDASSDAREQLIKRVAEIPATATAPRTDHDADAAAAIGPSVRLEPDGTTIPTGAEQRRLVGVVDHDGSRVG